MDFTKLKNCLDEILADGNTPSVDCIVYKNHEMIFRYFTGLSDIENNKSINGNELYFIFSMTKMLTCTAALQLFEQGVFSMEDKLSKFKTDSEEAFRTLKRNAASKRSGGYSRKGNYSS